MNCSPPGSSVHGILQARILEWVAMPSFRGSSQGLNLRLLCLLRMRVFNTSATWDYTYIYVYTYTHIYALFLDSIKVDQRILNIVPCAIQ